MRPRPRLDVGGKLNGNALLLKASVSAQRINYQSGNGDCVDSMSSAYLHDFVRHAAFAPYVILPQCRPE